MARVKIEDIIVNDLSREMRNALEEAVREVLPDADFDRAEAIPRLSARSGTNAALGSRSGMIM
jgi:hypothetical protein